MAVYTQSQYSRAETGGLSSEVSVGQAIYYLNAKVKVTNRIKKKKKSPIAVHTFNPTTQEADRWIFASSSLVYSVLNISHPHGWLNHYVPHTMKVNKGIPLNKQTKQNKNLSKLYSYHQAVSQAEDKHHKTEPHILSVAVFTKHQEDLLY